MRARQSRPRRTKGVTMTFEDGEFQEVERAAGSHDLGPFCRQIVMAHVATKLDPSERLILAEICATRRQIEELLRLISDLDDRDIHRARSNADLLRRALVEERMLELKQAEGGPADA
jgi:hypothetical protein